MEKIDLDILGHVNTDADMRSGIGKALRHWVTALALLGGLVLVMLVLMSVASIVGRVLFSKPIQGDYELAQMMAAMAVSLFLPYCHIQRAHVMVDFFTAKANKRFKHWLDAFAGLVFTIVAGVFAKQLFIGMIDGQHSGETSMLLSVPIWWPYIALVVAFATLCVTALYFALHDVVRALKSNK